MSDLPPSPASQGAKNTVSHTSHAAPKIRRRNRIITSCLECRRRKLKCDRSHPCNHCAKANRDCVFLSPALDSATKGKLNQFKESIDYLEKGLEKSAEDPNAPLGWKVSPQSSSLGTETAGTSSDGAQRRRLEPIPADERDLQPTTLALADVTYEEEGDDVMDDLGVAMGKLRITERIGGFVRPRFAEEMADALQRHDVPNSPSPPHVVDSIERTDVNTPSHSSEPNQAYLEPSAEYIAPGTGLLFSNGSSEDLSLITFLPSRDFADKLVSQYWFAVHPIARIVHRPSFERQYDQFWREISVGFEPTHSLQALVFALFLSASVSLSNEVTEREFGCAKLDMVKTFRSGCEYALSRSNLLRTTKVTTLQAFVMYIIPLCRMETSRSHAALVSMAIRLAECAGLHRDGSVFGLRPLETHVRRLIWHQLCFLDIRTVEAVGPRPPIRKADFDTEMPLNVNDMDFETFVPPNTDASKFTEMTVPRIEFECYELLREIWFERPNVAKGQGSLTGLLRTIENFREQAQKKYLPMLDVSVPIQAYAANLLQLLVSKSHVAVLHRYATSQAKHMPDRLFQILWTSGLALMELNKEQDSSPQLQPWSWYVGAHHQWQVALLFIILVQDFPDRPEVDRMWTCFDYIFEFPPNMSRHEKFRLSTTTMQFRLEEYQRQKKHRIPTSLEASLGTLGRVHRSSSTSPSQQDSTSSYQSMLGAQADPNAGFMRKNSNPRADTWGSTHSSSSARESRSPGFTAVNHPASPMPTIDFLAQSSNQSPFNFQPDMQFTNTNPNAVATQGQSMNINQPFANLDWDELDRLFPLDSTGQILRPPVMADSAGMSSDIPAMTYFPTGWLNPQNRAAPNYPSS